MTHKLLSDNPRHYPGAAVQGIRDLLDLNDDQAIPLDQIDTVKMGTTVATNALLERQGEPTLFVTTAGFADVLRIGYQTRPDLFALDIDLPEMLYTDVLEIKERVNADGEVLVELDEQAARQGLRQARINGFNSVAIVLLHGYRHTDHESRLAHIARELGFEQISVSHEVSALMKIVPRGDTTVVDAYLSPILRRYVAQVDEQLRHDQHGPRLMFMQSNGGLTDAYAFQGKGALLSPRWRGSRNGSHRRKRGPTQADRLRHGRNLNRRKPLRRRIRTRLRNRSSRNPSSFPDDGHTYCRSRRRLDPPL